MDLVDDLVQRRFRRQRVAGQRDIDAVRHRSFGNQRENFLGARLPVAAVNEQQRRSLVGSFQEIDPVALARAISDIEMLWVALPQRGRALLPAGDDVGAAGNRRAVVEAAIDFLPAHLPPVQRRKIDRHAQTSRPPGNFSAFYFAGKCSTARSSRLREGGMNGEKIWWPTKA